MNNFTIPYIQKLKIQITDNLRHASLLFDNVLTHEFGFALNHSLLRQRAAYTNRGHSLIT